ncbi:MAG: NUDIX hydrolase [Alphaproteobacteria bacterium]|nr:NUDIX hydrolase [Alphaproteobacteria bacterium]
MNVWNAIVRIGYRAAYRAATCWAFVTRPEKRCVTVIVRCDRNVLVVRPSYRRRSAPPGGYVGRGEDAADAAARELSEETGIRADPAALRYLGSERVTANYRRLHHMVFALDLDDIPALRVDGREIVRAEFVPWETAFPNGLPPLDSDLPPDRSTP